MSQKFCTVEEEYEKNECLKKEDVLILQEWMNKQAHLPKINEIKIIAFLHACYYKIEATKTCIENFYTLKAHWLEFTLERDIFSNSLQQALHCMLSVVLPIRTKEGHTIIYSRLMNTDPDVYHYLSQLKLFDMIFFMWSRILGTTKGQVVIMDNQGLSLGHIFKVNLAAMRKHIYFVQEAAPLRLKAIHIINVSPLTDKFLNLAKPFMHKEMIDLVHLHPNIETLYDHIPKETMPNEYGGRAGTFQELHEKQIKMMEENAHHFREDEKEIADESKRQGKPKNLDNIFGIEGTFKKLDID